jgi:hypothetical protein
MWTFQYKNGDRPLDGYTIQRAAGRGGFGEVYYALSDGGREVALKVVTGYEQIELRGISQCMNLKSPHLVTIFDVKYNDQGKPFVIMEFVSGPSLRQLLDESPAGLGTQKAAFFLREIGKGLTFLHECGIVHRDLKPGNIFFENGYVKIGDYGLSKAISPTQHSGQTVTVGTVHYMAPEVGVGKYDRSIDIYAMGAVLYEMLTGTVPFIGASPSEILMKHLQSEPDMTGVPEPFNTVIRKAMAKNPAERYQSVQEMVEAVFGAEHVRMSVSCFSSEDLSMVAGRVAQKVAVGAGGGGSSSVAGGSGSAGSGPRPNDPFAQVWERFQDRSDELRGRFQDRAQQVRNRLRSMGLTSDTDLPRSPSGATGINDAMSATARMMLGLLTAVVVAVASGLLIDNNIVGGNPPFGVPLFVFLAVASSSIALLVGWRRIVIPKLSNESPTVRKLAISLMVCGATLIGSGFIWALLGQYGHFHNGTWLAILAPLCLFNTWEWARANRKERISLGPAIGIAIVGLILSGIFDADHVIAIAVLAGTCLAVQVMAPWDPVLAASRGGKIKHDYQPDTPMNVYGNVTMTSKEAAAMRAAGANVYGNINISDAPRSSAPRDATPPALPGASYRLVPKNISYIWLGLFIFALPAAVMFFVGAGMTNSYHADEIPPLVTIGVIATLFSLLSIVRVFTKRFYGVWSYLIRPALMIAAVALIVLSGTTLGNVQNHDSTAQLFLVFFIVFPALVFATLPFLPRQFGSAVSAPNPSPEISPHSRGLTLGMACLWFCGAGGIHRFTVGKIGTGILWLLTGGLFGIGQLIDVIMICTGNFTDAEGRVVKYWEPAECAKKRQEWMAAKKAERASEAPTMPPVPQITMYDDAAINPEPTPPQPQAQPQPATSSWTPPPVPAMPPAPVFAPMSTGGFASGIAALLVFATVIVALAIGFDLPQAVTNQLPNPQVSQQIQQAVFSHSRMWENVVTESLWAVVVVLATISVGMMMAARRGTSAVHIFRGLLGIGGLLWAVTMLTSTFHKSHGWLTVAPFIRSNQNDAAMDAFFKFFTDGHPIAAVAICMAAFFMLTIPARRRAAERGMA